MINVHIKALNIELTDAIENYFREKLNNLDNLIDSGDESVDCNARVSKIAENRSGDIFRAEVNLHTAGKNFGAVADKQDTYVAIDEVVDRVGRKISDYKNKRRSLFKRGAQKIKQLLTRSNF